MDVIRHLELLSEKLGELCEEIVVVGGCSPALILDLSLAPDLRPTYDIDILVQAETYGKYTRFIEKIKEKGFGEREGDPIGRYVSEDLVVDIMPTEADVLGFTNRWYKKAFDKAVYKRLPSGRTIKTITPVYFIATKFEAFKSRGKDDLLVSADLEDIITVMVEVPAFEDELSKADRDVQKYIVEEFKKLISQEDYPYFLTALLRGDEASQASLPKLRSVIEKIASKKFRSLLGSEGE